MRRRLKRYANRMGLLGLVMAEGRLDRRGLG
jgi:hypothetical protein